MYKKLNFGILAVLFLLSTVCVYDLGWTHSGRTDANGGHYNRKTGKYHYHGGGRSRSPVSPTPAAPRTPVVTRPTPVAQDVTSQVSRRSELKLASWNIRILSDNSRDDAELQKIAQTLIDYDFIAITELRDEKVLKRVVQILSASGAEYGYLISEPVGRSGSSHREHYAFLYYKGLVSVVTDGKLYPDAMDGADDFVRDPYWATFRAGKFDFSVIAVHVVWGDSVAERRSEVMELAQVYSYVQKANGAEDDVLLVGDFNREPDDLLAYTPLMSLPSMTHLFQSPQKSHIGDSSLYDNIYFQKKDVTEYAGKSGIDKFDETDFGNDDSAANLAVSDHRPVWAVFRIDGSGTPSLSTPNLGVSDQRAITSVPQLPTIDETQAVTVYVTRTGKKYHRGGCRYLRRSKIPIALSSAKLRYGPCSLCGPPQSLLNEELNKLPVPSIDRSVDLPSLPKSNLRLDSIYPNANKVSTTKVNSENQSPSKPKVSSSQFPACKVCGGGNVVTKYGTKSHASTCRYVTNTKYPTRSRSSYSSGTVRVRGYYRKDGTYVRPHTRRKPRR